MTDKSDKKAKEFFIDILKKNGFHVLTEKNPPVDIVAEKNGVKYYFEVKKTTVIQKGRKSYFGAATATEWKCAFEKPETFRFVIVIDKRNGDFDFKAITPDEMMKFSTIPPFKVNFNLNLDQIQEDSLFTSCGVNEKNAIEDKISTKRSRNPALKLSSDVFDKLYAMYIELRSNQNKQNEHEQD